MKLLVRMFVMSLLFIVSSLTILDMVGHNDHLAELNTTISMAMTQTQLLKEENIQDQMYGTEISRVDLSDATTYRNQYIEHFSKLIGAEPVYLSNDSETSVTLTGGTIENDIDTDGDGVEDTTVNAGSNTKYTVEFYSTDAAKGLLSVGITGKYHAFGNTKTIYSTKSSIIEVDDSLQESITVTFNANGGVINSAGSETTSLKQEFTSGTQYGALPIPTRENFKFEGWFTAETGGTQIKDSSTVGNSNITLYAHWIAD